MIKIPDAAQIRAIDAYTIKHEPVKSIDLMERAAAKCFALIKKHMGHQQGALVFCGPGNNGGDGLAIARMMSKAGRKVEVWILQGIAEFSNDNLHNQKRLEKFARVKIGFITDASSIPQIEPDALVVDALFGSGLSRPLEGLPASLVRHINLSNATVFSIDIPSGLFCDNNILNDSQNIIRATYTFSFQFPKLAFLLPENEKYVGKWEILDIGLHPEAIRETSTIHNFLEAEDVKMIFRPRQKFSHKGHYGHALLLAGSEGKAGAAVLAAGGALRSGVGLLTAHVPRNVLPVIQSCVPEAMSRTDDDPCVITNPGDLSAFDAIAFGPGTGTDPQTGKALKLLIQNSRASLVVDADGLNILAQNLTWLPFLPKGTILTPHPREFERLVGNCQNRFEMLERARDFAFKFSVYVVLKGAHTAIVCPDKRVLFNSTGNPGMATGGSGDVLTGIILSHLAKGYTSLQAAMMGVYLHGLAGDLASARMGMEGLIAGDIVFHLPKASKKLFQ